MIPCKHCNKKYKSLKQLSKHLGMGKFYDMSIPPRLVKPRDKDWRMIFCKRIRKHIFGMPVKDLRPLRKVVGNCPSFLK